VKVELSAEADAQVQQIDSWWRENRQRAPDLFTDELDRALLMLEDSPTLGVPYELKRGVRRLLRRPRPAGVAGPASRNAPAGFRSGPGSWGHRGRSFGSESRGS
jgi:hypothetical protein